MRLLISLLSVVFAVLFTPTSKAADSHSVKNLVLKQTKRVREEINKLGTCKAMSGTLVWTCAKSKDKKSFNGSPKRMTIAQIVELGTYYKKSIEKEQMRIWNKKTLIQKILIGIVLH